MLLRASVRGSRSLSSFSAASQQLHQLPEVQQALSTAPPGSFVPSTQAADVAVTRAISGLGRAGDIVANLPLAYNVSYITTAAGVFESCGSIAGAYDLLNTAKTRSATVAGEEDLETIQNAVEHNVAFTRLSFASGKPPDSAAQNSHNALVNALSVGYSVKDSEGQLSKPPSADNIDAALRHLSLKLTLARAHGFGCWISPLTSQGNTNKAAGDIHVSPDKGSDTVVPHKQQADTLLKHVDLTADLLSQPASSKAKTDTDNSSFNVNRARAVGVLRLVSAAVKAQVERNYAAGVLARGLRLLYGSSDKSTATHTSTAQEVHSSLSTAFTLLQAANADVETARSAQESLKLDDAPEHLRQLSQQVRVDLCKHQAAILSSQAELALLSALWHLWELRSSPAAAMPSGPMFPLSAKDSEYMEPVVKQVGSLANASLKLYETIDADSSLASSTGLDFGIDLTGEMTRPLRTISLLQFMAEKPVMSEGLLRGSFDYYQRKRLRSAQGSHLHGLQGLDSSSWDVRSISYPPILQLSIAGHLRVYASLLSQWDRRDRESAAFGDTADRIVLRAVKPYGLTFRTTPPASHQRALLETLIPATAFATGHIGSFACALPDRVQQLADVLSKLKV